MFQAIQQQNCPLRPSPDLASVPGLGVVRGQEAGRRERLPPAPSRCMHLKGPMLPVVPQAHPQCWIPDPLDPGLCCGQPQFPCVHLGFGYVCVCVCVHVHTPLLPISCVRSLCGLLRTGQYCGVMVVLTWGAGQLVGESLVTA